MATTRGLIWPEPPPKGTLWVDPATGDSYRLRYYGVDWDSEDMTETVPHFVVSYARGAHSNTDSLPKGAVCVFFPEEA